jgi:hypothetical protein
MKNLLYLISALIVVTSCSGTKEARTARAENRNQKKLTEQLVVKQAVESRRYIIKLERIYMPGGMVTLIPRANYIIVDGQKAIITAAYFGRQWDIRPIAGINVRGVATDYVVTSNVAKGKYEIRMKVANKNTSFDVYLTIGKNGSCDASVNSLKISNARYKGYVVPISDNPSDAFQNTDVI